MIRPPSPETPSETSSETEELKEIFHEASPPALPDWYIQDQIVLPVDYDHSKIGNELPLIFKHRGACVSETLVQIVDSSVAEENLSTSEPQSTRERDGWAAMVLSVIVGDGQR